MEGWMKFLSNHGIRDNDISSLRKLAGDNFDEYAVYPGSLQTAEGTTIFMARHADSKALLAFGGGSLYDELEGEAAEAGGRTVKVCDLSVENNKAVRRAFPFTRPSSHREKNITIGLGDRLGLASPAHIRLIRDYDVFPVLAQQSVRELNLTGRTFDGVLAAASWAVLQEGYTGGFGADGDHLKTHQEVMQALDCGYTMITLDCSEHIDNKAAALSGDELERQYLSLPGELRQSLESRYLGRRFALEDGLTIDFSPEELKKIVLIYHRAIEHTSDIYVNAIKSCGRSIDFELSIDETLTPTTPESHYFVASELDYRGIVITSLAPRFCGEFQKGIDYKGDHAQFVREFDIHCKIAGKFGYKISVHSGSDKFQIFPTVGEKTGGRYHLKTAGTNWLEAVRVIAELRPSLYRKMHTFALSKLEEAKKYYHIGADVKKIPDISSLEDGGLPRLMELDDARQVLHITYGFILQAKKPDGSYIFRDEIYDFLNKHEAEYYKALQKHIGRHLLLLGAKPL